MDSDQDWGPKWSTHYTPEIYCRTMMVCGFNPPEQICSSFRVHSPELFRI